MTSVNASYTGACGFKYSYSADGHSTYTQYRSEDLKCRTYRAKANTMSDAMHHLDQLKWHIWFDGSACPNPGRIGLGVLVVGPDGQRKEYSGIVPQGGCNNEAELRALGKALEMARESGAHHVLLQGDSDFVVRHVNGLDTTEIVRLRELILHTRDLLTGFAECRLVWIPRHRNRDADRLSRTALGLPDKPGLHPGKLKTRRRR